MSLLTGGAFAADSTGPTPASSARTSQISAVQSALGIPADGVAGPVTRKAVRAFQRSKGLTVDGIVGPQTLAALGVTSGSGATARTRSAGAGDAATAAAATGNASPLLESIALCESGGDPTMVSASGQYRGKYQFDRETWASVGGSGDPASAPEAEQDRRAQTLLSQRGASAWPVCSKKVGAG